MQEFRLRIGATFLEIKQFQQNGSWGSLRGDGTAITRSSIAQCATGECIAVSDLDGNGYADLVYLGTDGHVNFILTPLSGAYFAGSIQVSSIQALIEGFLIPQTTNSWEMGDIDGDGKDELISSTKHRRA